MIIAEVITTIVVLLLSALWLLLFRRVSAGSDIVNFEIAFMLALGCFGLLIATFSDRFLLPYWIFWVLPTVGLLYLFRPIARWMRSLSHRIEVHRTIMKKRSEEEVLAGRESSLTVWALLFALFGYGLGFVTLGPLLHFLFELPVAPPIVSAFSEESNLPILFAVFVLSVCAIYLSCYFYKRAGEIAKILSSKTCGKRR